VSVSRRSLSFLIFLAVLICFWIFRTPLINEPLAFLVLEDPPAKADMAVVLGGDGSGQRIMKAADLVRAGYVPSVLVSGPIGFYDTAECDLAIAFAVRHGYPESYFVHFPAQLHSTEDEGREIPAELERRHVKSIILVTSGFHTRRAGRIFKRNKYGIKVLVVAAPDLQTDNGAWWHDREGRKKIFTEWLKTITGPLGI
jgi:uncharacterized SAM-binding protein YcdF (DUF218 family)